MSTTRLACRLIVVFATLTMYKTSAADQWIDFRLGVVDSNPTIALQGNYSAGDKLYSATWRYGSYLLDRSYYREFSVGMGRRYTHRYGTTTLQAGIGLFELEDKDNRDYERRVEPTVPLSATFVLGKYVGLSSTAFVNINRVEPFVGISFGVALGKFN